LQLLVDQVAATGEVPDGQAALLTGFVRRTLHREVVERRHRLFAPGALLSEDDVEQVIQQAWPGPYDLPGEGALISQLEALAFKMQDAREAGEAAQVRLAEKAARNLLAQAEAGAIIDAGIQLNVLDKDLARRDISFFHQLVQEYFAARVLGREPQPERLAVSWQGDRVKPSLAETLAALEASDPLPPLPATGWEETAILAAAMALDQEAFVAALMPINLPLAARCAAAAEVQVSPRLAGELQEALLARIGDPRP
jgi:predicted NACHT family NTPase